MGIQNSTVSPTINMKAFVAVSALLAAAAADQTHHQVIKHGNAPAVSHSVHKPHGSYAAVVASQPHAAPQDVHNPYAGEKASTAVHAPAHVPVHAPVYHAAPVLVHKPEPVGPAVYKYGYAVADDYSGANFAANEGRDGYATNGEYRVALPDGRTQIVSYNVADAYSGYVADVKYEGEAHYEPYNPAPVVHKPAPYHPAPVVHKPAPVYHPAPIVHKPAPYHPAPAYNEPSYDGPAVYHYDYAVADDYSGANFAANENRDGYATTGEYRVALPDGRTQIVTYNVADGYSGYVADVSYEGQAHYAPAPAKGYHAAPVVHKPAPVYHPAPAYH